MAYIVHGATGAQGAPVLSALAASGHTPVAAVRHTKAVPAGTAAREVDLLSADSLAAAYDGAEGVFVHLPMGAMDSAAQARAVVDAVSRVRPGRVVISTSGQIVDQPGSPLQAAPDSPIMKLINGVIDSGVSVAVVAPRLYLENLLLPVVLDPVRQDGVLRYPLPASYPVAWSSHLDVADAVARLLLDTSITGTVAVGHRPGLRGPDLAAAFSSHLDRDVRFEAITPEAFGELITTLFGPAAAPVVDLYRALNAQDDNTISESNSAQTVLGLQPRPVEEWLKELAV
ncbi:SDR family oxidoreductase [Actinomyces sp.]|uniref:SDR family oxidoreductase n=1 Tax=Actinomyces sp. TaxID=29317 RepID=UPI0026DCD48B|nr:NAD(P)H-binding protein [Actinomyces sp.]MDO4900991.1 NAD(P)H-binding protein [Actinomyces sp.]